jgi:hypothetical protein
MDEWFGMASFEVSAARRRRRCVVVAIHGGTPGPDLSPVIENRRPVAELRALRIGRPIRLSAREGNRMEIETARYDRSRGWMEPIPEALDSGRTVLLAFGDASLERSPAVFRELRRAMPGSAVIGCSTAGEIHGRQLHDGSLVVAAARFDGVDVRVASASIHGAKGSFAGGAAVARELASPALRAIFVLSEGLNVNGSELARGIESATPPGVVVSGGLAGDADRFGRTWVLDGEIIASNRVVALGFYGDRAVVTHGSRGGWHIFGLERRITRSEGNVVYEIDGRPALKLYMEYLGERAIGLPATALLFPLALRLEGGEVVRTILAIDEQTQSLTFAGDVPEGSIAQLMHASRERLIQGASEAAQEARPGAVDGPARLAISISCVGRRLVLNERAEEEIEATLDACPAGTRQIGYYSYGELSPRSGGGSCDLHNQTMTITLVSEA